MYFASENRSNAHRENPYSLNPVNQLYNIVDSIYKVYSTFKHYIVIAIRTVTLISGGVTIVFQHSINK
jgi:hypothetical protein